MHPGDARRESYADSYGRQISDLILTSAFK
jgi:hypothetical protein